MEQALRELKNYSRWLKLEQDIPRLEENLAEAKALCIDAGGRVRLAQWELERLEKPGFLLRMKGGLEERKEEAYREHRLAQAQYQSAQQEAELRKQELAEAKAEFAALSGSWKAYLREKEGADGINAEETDILTALAIGLSRDCQDALEQARNWMRQDVLRTGVSQQNRKMEFLALAAEKAARIREILEQLPRGTVEIPSYLDNPEGYITCVTMEYKQLDRVNLVIEQIYDLRNRLKER